MAIPKFQEMTLPMLKLALDGMVWPMSEAREKLATHFQLAAEELEELRRIIYRLMDSDA